MQRRKHSIPQGAQDEGDQTFTVTLDSPTQAQLGDASGVATIVNDDITPVVTLLTAASGVVAPVTQDTIAIECAFTDGNDPSKTTLAKVWQPRLGKGMATLTRKRYGNLGSI